jgi:hypothetical protein
VWTKLIATLVVLEIWGITCVFKLQEHLEKTFIGYKCVAHIVHNCMQTTTNSLSIDIDTIVAIYTDYFIHTLFARVLPGPKRGTKNSTTVT